MGQSLFASLMLIDIQNGLLGASSCDDINSLYTTQPLLQQLSLLNLRLSIILNSIFKDMFLLHECDQPKSLNNVYTAFCCITLLKTVIKVRFCIDSLLLCPKLWKTLNSSEVPRKLNSLKKQGD